MKTKNDELFPGETSPIPPGVEETSKQIHEVTEEIKEESKKSYLKGLIAGAMLAILASLCSSITTPLVLPGPLHIRLLYLLLVVPC